MNGLKDGRRAATKQAAQRRSHAQASGTKQSTEPYFFIKMPTLMTPHGAPICKSKTSEKHDSEIELAVIIGKRGKYISRENAFDHIAGYSVINDFRLLTTIFSVLSRESLITQ